MAFDPTLPVEDSELDAEQMRNQFNALKSLLDDLAPLVPVLARDNNGNWTLTYLQTPPTTWSVCARFEGHPDWYPWEDVAFTDFPLTDADMKPPGAWWQVKIAGENDVGIPCTPFSNVVSFGNVPA
jgi:hypothetical protein